MPSAPIPEIDVSKSLLDFMQSALIGYDIATFDPKSSRDELANRVAFRAGFAEAVMRLRVIYNTLHPPKETKPNGIAVRPQG